MHEIPEPVVRYLAARRVHRPLPSCYVDILDMTGGVTRPGVDPARQDMSVHGIYTAEASSLYLLLEDQKYLLIDFRFVDFVLDLISACEQDDATRTAMILLAMNRLALEHSLRYPNAVWQLGALLDFAGRAAARQGHERGADVEPDLGRVEFIAKLVVAHEAAHVWIEEDLAYRKRLLDLLDTEIEWYLRVARAQEFEDTNVLAKAASEARLLLRDAEESGELSDDLEELLCDQVMARSAAAAAVATPEGKAGFFNYLSMTSSTLTALWTVPTLQQVVSSWSSTSSVTPGEGDFRRRVRHGLAMMTFMRLGGLAFNEGDNEQGGRTAELWSETSDFESHCVQCLLELSNEETKLRLETQGREAERLGWGNVHGAASRILQQLHWVEAEP